MDDTHPCRLSRRHSGGHHLFQSHPWDNLYTKGWDIAVVNSSQPSPNQSDNKVADKESRPDDKTNANKNMIVRFMLEIIDWLMQRLLFKLHEDNMDGLKSPNTAYMVIDTDDYKAEQELVEKYQSFVSEIMRLSLATIGVFSFLILNIKPPMVISRGGFTSACIGVMFLVISIFFAMRFQFGASEGLRWYIAGFRYHRPPEYPSSVNIQETLNRRAAIIQKCRYDKFCAALCLIIGAGCMAFAMISALETSSDRDGVQTWTTAASCSAFQAHGSSCSSSWALVRPEI